MNHSNAVFWQEALDAAAEIAQAMIDMPGGNIILAIASELIEENSVADSPEAALPLLNKLCEISLVEHRFGADQELNCLPMVSDIFLEAIDNSWIAPPINRRG